MTRGGAGRCPPVGGPGWVGVRDPSRGAVSCTPTGDSDEAADAGGWARLGGYFDGYVWFFSEDPRTEREKAPVREFLRYLGVGFAEGELVVPLKHDDVDVRFREARFQNVERIAAARRGPAVR